MHRDMESFHQLSHDAKELKLRVQDIARILKPLDLSPSCLHNLRKGISL